VTTIAVLSPFCRIALSVKRLHDIDASGWYALTTMPDPVLTKSSHVTY
jgi:uncharacterized membrane protein YhaH (DUF805 family)